MRRETWRIAALQLVGALATTGCLTARSPYPRSFTIDAPAPKSLPQTGGLVVAVARVEVAPEYSGQAFVYQTRDHELVRDPYARFAALPSSLLATAMRPHGVSWMSGVQTASLDHIIWFHRPTNLSRWHLYVQDSPSASGARGFSRGSIFTRDGRLVASVAQEGLIREHSGWTRPAGQQT